MKNKILLIAVVVSVGYNVYQSQGKNGANANFSHPQHYSFQNLEELKTNTENTAKKLDETNPAHAEQLRRMLAEMPVDIPNEMAEKMKAMPKNIAEAKSVIAKNEILLKEINQLLDKKQQ